MVEDGNRSLSYHFGCDGHAAECRGGVCRHLRLVVSVVEARLLPGRAEAGRVPRPLRAERFPTVELNTTGYRLPAEGQFERWAEQTPEGFRFAPKLNAYRTSDFATFEERVTRLGDRLGPIRVLVGTKRDEGPDGADARLARPVAPARVRLPARVLGGRRAAGERGARRRPRRVRPVPLPPLPRPALLGGRPRRDSAERIAPLLAQGVEVFAYFRHEDEPTAPEYARRFGELLADFTPFGDTGSPAPGSD